MFSDKEKIGTYVQYAIKAHIMCLSTFQLDWCVGSPNGVSIKPSDDAGSLDK